MAGIYVHIPFCKQACHYCNFHFSTTFSSYRADMIQSIQREMEIRSTFFSLEEQPVQTVYFGGGTPSLLTPKELDNLIHTLWKTFKIASDAEVTLEANPDDMDETFLQHLKNSPVNRLSIGIQSLNEDDLKYLHRAHNADQAMLSVEKALSSGIQHISADLIFGIPTSGLDRLKHDVKRFAEAGVEHISAYGLTVEPKTALESLISRKKYLPVDEVKSAEEMEWLMHFLPEMGYRQYEISNYALPGAESKHNSSYWERKPYLGLGPSAHSYRDKTRCWNVANNTQYIQSLKASQPLYEEEILNEENQYNEYVMTGLRTQNGISFTYLETTFHEQILQYFDKQIKQFIENGLISKQGHQHTLTFKGKLFADQITEVLFFIP
jgi:oxygen-independent coproporphyrinogen III oxidase